MAKPLVIDLFCGLGGWTEAFLDEGWDAIGFDIERHDYGTGGYPGQLVLQDVLTLSGLQFRGRAALIVASPPCQKYSYMAMPWSRSKQLAAWYREDVTRQLQLNCLFNACFRIAHEAELPLVVENVRGAEPWVGGARWHYGSFYFWGDVPALMPATSKAVLKRGVAHRANGETNFHASAARSQEGVKAGDRNKGRANGEHKWDTEFKVPGFRFDGSGKSFQSASVNGTKQPGMSWSGSDKPGDKPEGFNVRNAREFRESQKGFVDGLGKGHDWRKDPVARFNSKSDSRKAASAIIAKIPYPLAQHIARVFKP